MDLLGELVSMTFAAGSDSLAHKRGRGAQSEGTQVCARIETHQRRLRIGGDVLCYEQEVAVPDDHTLLLSLKVDEAPGCSLGGFASVTKNPKVLFFTEPGPGRIAPASATVRLPPIASAYEDVVHLVVRARLKRQGGAALPSGETEAPTVLTIFLRQRGSAESKPVAAPYHAAGG
jgi:hypothetical protein